MTAALQARPKPRPRPVSGIERRREEQLLGEFASSRSEELREQLIERFMPLARSLAMRYRGGSESLEDLVQVANLGLVKAVDGFDPARGRPFTAYAVPTILGELRRHFRDHVWSLHLPRSLQDRTIAVEEAITTLAEQNARYPTVGQVAARLGIDEEDVIEAMRAGEARRTLSLDAPRMRDEGESAPTVETVEDEELGYDGVEARMAYERAGLEDREWLVLRLRFGQGLSQYEIGGRLGVSQMQVSRIMRGALRKLLAAVRAGAEAEPAAVSGSPPDAR